MQDLKKVISEQDLTLEQITKIQELVENSQEQEIVIKASIYSIFEIKTESIKQFFSENRFKLKRKKISINNFSKQIYTLLPIETKQTKVKTKGNKVAPEFKTSKLQSVCAFSSYFVKFNNLTGSRTFATENMIDQHSLSQAFFNIVNGEDSNINIILNLTILLSSFDNIKQVKDFIEQIDTIAGENYVKLKDFKENYNK